MSNNLTTRNTTRNQSTGDFQQKRVFTFDNRFERGIYKNTTGSSLDLKEGMFVARSTSVTNGLIPVTSSNPADVIGVVALEGGDVVTLANNATVNIAFCTKGSIDASQLVFPASLVLTTVVGNKTFQDVLEGIGLHVETTTVELTKFDN